MTSDTSKQHTRPTWSSDIACDILAGGPKGEQIFGVGDGDGEK